jgi:hypothetical protein
MDSATAGCVEKLRNNLAADLVDALEALVSQGSVAKAAASAILDRTIKGLHTPDVPHLQIAAKALWMSRLKSLRTATDAELEAA